MRSIIALLAICQISVFASAATQEEEISEYQQIWTRTNYSLDALFSEKEFQPLSCLKNVKYYTACILTLNSMLTQPEAQPQELVRGAGENENRFVIIPLVVPKPVTIEFLKEKATTLKQDAAAIYEAGNYQALAQSINVGNFSNAQGYQDVATLIFEVKEIVKNAIPVEKLAMVAGESYNFLLNESYDPHYTFGPAEQAKVKSEKFYGIGAEVSKFDRELEAPTKIEAQLKDVKGAIAASPFPGSPAAEAGLQKGDLLLAADGVDLRGLDLNKAVALIRGKEGTTVKLTVSRVCDGSVEEISVARKPWVHNPDWLKDSKFVSLEDNVETQLAAQCGWSEEKKAPTTIEEAAALIAEKAKEQQLQQMTQHQVLYIPLRQFHLPEDRDLVIEFVQLLGQEWEAENSIGIILDLRNNPGGRLDGVTDMLDVVISADGPIVSTLEVKEGNLIPNGLVEVAEYFHYDRIIKPSKKGIQALPITDYPKPIVVLVNGRSASASEIFAGTIQDMKRGWIVGDRTFGKGSVQTVNPNYTPPLAGWVAGEGLHKNETTAIYTLPSGRSPQNYGIIPDFRFDEFGKPIVDDPDYVNVELKLNGIGFNADYKWEQNRPEELEQMSQCVFNNEGGPMQSETLKAKMSEDGIYRRPFISDYQLELAKDIIHCSLKYPPTI